MICSRDFLRTACNHIKRLSLSEWLPEMPVNTLIEGCNSNED